MTTLRTRIFIIFSIFFLFVLAVSIILIVLSKQKQAAVETPSAAAPTTIDSENFAPEKVIAPAAQVTPSAGMAVKPMTTEEQMKNAAKQMAKIFVERYGTYSTDNNFSNIKEVEVLCSPDLWKILSARMAAGQTNNGFTGVTTNAITSVITAWQADKATVEINTIRTETKNGATSSKNQKAVVTLVKIGGNWLVDDMKWGQ